MNYLNRITIKEHDSIACGKENGHDDRYYYLNDKVFNELESFIYDYSSNESDIDINSFLKFSYKKGIRKVITMSNYVGLIQLPSGFQIEILPKIDFENNSNDVYETKKIFIDMLLCLDNFKGKKMTLSNLDVSNLPIFEIFISSYVKEVNEIIRKGIKSDYITINDNLNCFKGKIDIVNNIKKNTGRNERVCVIYDDYLSSRPENRLIKKTLNFLLLIAKNNTLQNEIKHTLLFFDEIDESINIQKDMADCNIDRNMSYYSTVIEWSKIFLSNKSFSSFSGNGTGLALLFPMEKLFEKFILKKVKQIFAEDGWEVKGQDSHYHLYEYPTPQFSLRPDIVVRKNDKCCILDTKWKRLSNNPQDNFHISQADMYQMYAYSKKYSNEKNIPLVYLIFPKSKETRELDIKPFKDSQGVEVHVFFVDLKKENINDSINELLQKIDGIYSC